MERDALENDALEALLLNRWVVVVVVVVVVAGGGGRGEGGGGGKALTLTRLVICDQQQ